MDIQLKKLELIEWIAQISDVHVITKMDKIRRSYLSQKEEDMKPMSIEEFNADIEKAEEDNIDIHVRFDGEMLALYRNVGRETGYWANYYLRAVRKYGGLIYAKKLLSNINSSQQGLYKLSELGKLYLSVEFLVLKEEYKFLFTDIELHEAQRRLNDLLNK
ncbi:MAG: hypothetical protein GZ094_16485 [Mariniphaga sp.]|nr:hypothetical protein [Mariniphaga sp.]